MLVASFLNDFQQLYQWMLGIDALYRDKRQRPDISDFGNKLSVIFLGELIRRFPDKRRSRGRDDIIGSAELNLYLLMIL